MGLDMYLQGRLYHHGMKYDKKNYDSKIKLILISKIGKIVKTRSMKSSILKNYLDSKLF